MNNHRQMFVTTWAKFQENKALSQQEQTVLQAILKYPQYHSLLAIDNTFSSLDDNPFFVMGLHLALWDQLRTNRPEGIKTLYEQALCQWKSVDVVEEKMMSVLKALILSHYPQGAAPSDIKYLTKMTKALEISA